jgi:hypothetical protein
MKLTASQIAQIEETLALNQVVFEDIKLELTDHIASDIEVVLSQEEIPFEEAMVIVFEKWSPQLRPSTSFWTPNNLRLPRILLNKYIVEYKKQFVTGSIIALVAAILLTLVTQSSHNNFFLERLTVTLQTVYCVEIILIISSKFVVWKSKIHTFNSFVFQKQTSILFLICTLIVPVVLVPNLLSEPLDFKLSLARFFMFLTYIVWFIMHLRLAINHFKFVQSIKTSLK